METDMSVSGIVLEIRAGVGGQEAALFAQELVRMYSRFGLKQGWKVELLHTAVGATDSGMREALLLIRGEDAYPLLKGEGGVHCLQRVSPTDKRGRVHTSTASVAALQEVVENKTPLDLREFRFETTRAGGSGGQNVNKTETSVRVTHIPTGMTVRCEDERSQLQNKERALLVLRSRIEAQTNTRDKQLRQDVRRGQIQENERAQRKRTYDLPEDMVLDREQGIKLKGAKRILDGNLTVLLGSRKRQGE